MKYGYVADDALLDRIHFALPADDPGNSSVLQAGTGPQEPPVLVGCAEYRLPEWNGLIYPPGTREGDMLKLYSRQFQLLELNATHYRIYSPEQIGKWRAAAEPEPFLFMPKFPKAISHENHGFDTLQELTTSFVEGINAFRPLLGPLFLQMSEAFTPHGRGALFAFLASLPEGYSYFLELRHPDWFQHEEVRAELLAALRSMGIGLVITDTPGHREVCHMAVTIPKVMIRFVGRHGHPSTAGRIEDWSARIRAWLDAGLESAYFIVHTGLSAPRTAAQIVGRFNEMLKTQIPLPVFTQSDELFPR